MTITAHVYQIYINADADLVWAGITESEWKKKYFHGTSYVEGPVAGARFRTITCDGRDAIDGVVEEMTPPAPGSPAGSCRPGTCSTTPRWPRSRPAGSSGPSSRSASGSPASGSCTATSPAARSPGPTSRTAGSGCSTPSRPCWRPDAPCRASTTSRDSPAPRPTGDWHRRQGVEANNAAFPCSRAPRRRPRRGAAPAGVRRGVPLGARDRRRPGQRRPRGVHDLPRPHRDRPAGPRPGLGRPVPGACRRARPRPTSTSPTRTRRGPAPCTPSAAPTRPPPPGGPPAPSRSPTPRTARSSRPTSPPWRPSSADRSVELRRRTSWCALATGAAERDVHVVAVAQGLAALLLRLARGAQVASRSKPSHALYMWSFQMMYMIPIRRARASVLPALSVSLDLRQERRRPLPVGLPGRVEPPVEGTTLLVLRGAAGLARAGDAAEAAALAVDQPVTQLQRAGLGLRRALRLGLVGGVVLDLGLEQLGVGCPVPTVARSRTAASSGHETRDMGGAFRGGRSGTVEGRSARPRPVSGSAQHLAEAAVLGRPLVVAEALDPGVARGLVERDRLRLGLPVSSTITRAPASAAVRSRWASMPRASPRPRAGGATYIRLTSAASRLPNDLHVVASPPGARRPRARRRA